MTSVTNASASPSDAPPKSAKRKLLIVALVGVLLAAMGIGGFLQTNSGPKDPEPGEVLALEPVQLNLAGGSYLRVGIALQLTAVAEEPEGSRALDATIAKFSGLPLSEVNDPVRRSELKKELEEELIELYEGDVMGMYLVDFVTQ